MAAMVILNQAIGTKTLHARVSLVQQYPHQQTHWPMVGKIRYAEQTAYAYWQELQPIIYAEGIP